MTDLNLKMSLMPSVTSVTYGNFFGTSTLIEPLKPHGCSVSHLKIPLKFLIMYLVKSVVALLMLSSFKVSLVCIAYLVSVCN